MEHKSKNFEQTKNGHKSGSRFFYISITEKLLTEQESKNFNEQRMETREDQNFLEISFTDKSLTE